MVGGIALKNVDNIYIAGFVPLMVLICDHFLVRRPDKEVSAPVAS